MVKIITASSCEDLSNKIDKYILKGWKSIELPSFFPMTKCYKGKYYQVKQISTTKKKGEQIVSMKIEHQYLQTIIKENQANMTKNKSI